MRLFFTLCLMLCVVAVVTPMASDAEVTTLVETSSFLDRPNRLARPTTVTVVVTPSPSPSPAQAPESRIFAPSQPVPKVAAAPTPDPTPQPTPEPTAKAAEPAPTAQATAKPKPTTSPTNTTTYSRDQVIAGIRSGWGGDDNKAIDVAECESGLNPRASNGVYRGLWQFHPETWSNYGGTGDPRDHSPQVQTQVAWRVFGDHGWSAWGGCA